MRVCVEASEQLGIKSDTLSNWVKVVGIDDGELSASTSADSKRIADFEKGAVG